MANGEIEVHFNVDGTAMIGADALRPVVERIGDSFLPPPTLMRVTDLKNRAVKGYGDPAIEKALDRKRYCVDLLTESEDTCVIFHQKRNGTGLAINFPATLAQTSPTSELRQLFVDLCLLLSPVYASCHLGRHADDLHQTHYNLRPRTFFACGLYWLNFFGPEEEALQGGPALENNPFARAERFAQGLLLEVGDGPFDALTPEGEQRLLAATAAMPPHRPVAPPPEPAPVVTAKPELITIGGVRGFHDSADGAFWISKNLARSATLDAKTIDNLRALVGQGEPPITRVQVLFSRKETAERNRSRLDKAGIGTWYVDPQTAQPRQV